MCGCVAVDSGRSGSKGRWSLVYKEMNVVLRRTHDISVHTRSCYTYIESTTSPTHRIADFSSGWATPLLSSKHASPHDHASHQQHHNHTQAMLPRQSHHRYHQTIAPGKHDTGRATPKPCKQALVPMDTRYRWQRNMHHQTFIAHTSNTNAAHIRHSVS